MLKRCCRSHPDCDGIVLGGHGFFSWGETSESCYVNTIELIDQFGQFVQEHVDEEGDQLFGGALYSSIRSMRPSRSTCCHFYVVVFRIRGVIGNYSALPEVLRFVNSVEADKLAGLGTSCPDHFIRTKVRPLFVYWDRRRMLPNYALRSIGPGAVSTGLFRLYRGHALSDSPAMRNANPTVVLIPGLGMFSFAKSRAEARITSELYMNAIHVMEGASALADTKANKKEPVEYPQAGPAAPSSAFESYSNYVAMPSVRPSGSNTGLLKRRNFAGNLRKNL